LAREVYGEMSYSRHTWPPSDGSVPLPFTTRSTPGWKLARELRSMAERESAVKKPGSLGGEEGRPKSDGAEPLVPTFVSRGKAGADIVDESWPNEPPELDEEMETPLPRGRELLPGEVVV